MILVNSLVEDISNILIFLSLSFPGNSSITYNPIQADLHFYVADT